MFLKEVHVNNFIKAFLKNALIISFILFNMKHLITFISLLFILNIAFGQRPMTLDKIESKLDSITNEAKFLFSYNLIKKKLKLENDSNFIIYLKLDTFNVITLLNNNLTQVKLYGDNEFYENYFEIPVINIDTNGVRLLYLKQKAINYIREFNLQKKLKKPFFFNYVFSETSFGFNFYAISSTIKSFTFPLDTNYVYQFDKNMELLKIKILPHKITHIDYDINTEMIILVYDKTSPLIYATDIFKFNLYRFESNIELLDAYSISSRRKFIYNPKTNKIEVK